jgi:4-amino-4-deoxy-L-arabinose transferase-like glycosyltransferase
MLVGWEPRRLARSRSILAAVMVLLFALSWALAVVHYKSNLELARNELARGYRR